ncbi:hypothetical protein HanRHA438_Chr13g0604841 [Helianthus annuus]|nr:hypothetical protein HanRHA438_Chr13g0604841 [Helianthus annuus]
MNLAGFDIVLGMDWLIANKASILCDQKSIQVNSPRGEKITIKGDKPSRSTKFISVMKTASYIRKGSLVYLISIITNVTPQPMAESSGRDTERNRLSRSFHNNYKHVKD